SLTQPGGGTFRICHVHLAAKCFDVDLRFHLFQCKKLSRVSLTEILAQTRSAPFQNRELRRLTADHSPSSIAI
ncbi:MAG TPA: hypothetical protein VFH15_10980, partial [Pyrinomonadaceae bacterium]|nr:hypothetical protein [Pyrinomonadaceae bacterium]